MTLVGSLLGCWKLAGSSSPRDRSDSCPHQGWLSHWCKFPLGRAPVTEKGQRSAIFVSIHFYAPDEKNIHLNKINMDIVKTLVFILFIGSCKAYQVIKEIINEPV